MVVSPFYYMAGCGEKWVPRHPSRVAEIEVPGGTTMGNAFNHTNEFMPQITFLQDMNYRSSVSVPPRRSEWPQ